MTLVVSVLEEPWDAPDSDVLREALAAELAAAGPEHELPERCDPLVLFLVARSADGTAVGCGGLQRLGPAEAELGDVYVRPDCRRLGVGAALVHQLEERAREAGLTVVSGVLPVAQTGATRFLEHIGYRRVPTLDGATVRLVRTVADD
ncbi:GNAT family N-acetyltransferase [Jatrophihabitans fulvus]